MSFTILVITLGVELCVYLCFSACAIDVGRENHNELLFGNKR